MALSSKFSPKRLEIASFLLLLQSLASSAIELCPGGLKCKHGGQCQAGNKNWSTEHYEIMADLPWLEELNVNGMHCTNCHEGWGGVDCNRKYQKCDANDPNAPVCFHGADCYKMGINSETGDYDYMCDCTTATEQDGSRYAGQFCQHVEEIRCDDEMFCTNGGKCLSIKDENSQHKHFVCECPSRRAGTHCEFDANHHFDDCNLKCERGTCAKGFKSYDFLVGTGPFPAQLGTDLISASGEHCVCPHGWTGLTCEIAVTRCSSKKLCYNGASCVYDTAGNPHCDCNSAHTNYQSFAGLSCEQEGTSYCEPGQEQDQKDAFCTNDGKCIDDPDRKHEGCECPKGWSGDLCDIEGDEEPKCDLKCENGGSCRFGVKGYKDSYDDLHVDTLEVKHEDGMYCSCPAGFTGVRCETDINHCHVPTDGEQEHFCLHGTACSQDDPELDGVTKRYSCDCDEKEDEITQMLAGRFCEYAVTEFCSKDRMRHSHSFCTNGGRCKRINDHADTEHHGCCCPEGFEGEYCQLPKGVLKEGTPVTWSPLEECEHRKSSPETVQKAPPVSYVPMEHSSSNDTIDEEVEDTVEPLTEVPNETVDNDIDTSSKEKSSKAIILSCVFVVIFVGGLVGYRQLKRTEIEEAHGFDWPPPPESPGSSANLGRAWAYPADDHSFSPRKWEYSDEHGELHHVVI